MIRYTRPQSWLKYDKGQVLGPLSTAKAMVISLTSMPYQREWADEMRRIQLKREVAGTSKIEGAEFTDKELDAAMHESVEQLETRSQKQAAAAANAYRWIAQQPADRPVNEELICEIHRLIVTGADDDHCPPGKLRGPDDNVIFGHPRHRGAPGGDMVCQSFQSLCEAVRTEFQDHDPLIQALALHYHFAAMHPFLDGNGRTARALEALMLQRVGLRETPLFIAMSNYYYDEKNAYLKALADVRAQEYDLTPFILLGLKGIEQQCKRLFSEIKEHISKALFRQTMTELVGRLTSPRKRVVTGRQFEVLKLLLQEGELTLEAITEKTKWAYTIKNPYKILIRDLNQLIHLQAIRHRKDGETYIISINLEWPSLFTQTELSAKIKTMPKAKTVGFLAN